MQLGINASTSTHTHTHTCTYMHTHTLYVYTRMYTKLKSHLSVCLSVHHTNNSVMSVCINNRLAQCDTHAIWHQHNIISYCDSPIIDHFHITPAPPDMHDVTLQQFNYIHMQKLLNSRML